MRSRFAAAVVCAGLGTALLAVSSGAQTTGHASVFQAQGEGAAIGTFYTRPATLPTGPDVVAASFGFSRTQVSILNSLGLGAYLWMGDLAASYKEAVVLGAEAAPPSFKDVVLNGPDYPFMAKARVPGSDAERARRTSLTGSFEGESGLVLDAGKAEATAESDASTGSSTVAGLRLETPNQGFRNAMASLRQQLAVITGTSPVASDPGVVIGFDNARSASVSRFEGQRLIVKTTSGLNGVSALEGIVQISKISAEAVSTSDGKTTTAKPRTALSGVTVGPYAALVDGEGVKVVDRSLSSSQLKDVNKALGDALAVAGVELLFASEFAQPRSGTEVAFASAAALNVRLNIERVYGQFRDRLPSALLQQAVAGDTMRFSVGVASSAAAVVPDSDLAFASEFGTDAGSQVATGGNGAASVLGEQLEGAPLFVPSAPTSGEDGTIAAPTDSLPLRALPAGNVEYLGIPGWAIVLAAIMLLGAGVALSFLGVWQML